MIRPKKTPHSKITLKLINIYINNLLKIISLKNYREKKSQNLRPKTQTLRLTKT